jgi:hypothetical protein
MDPFSITVGAVGLLDVANKVAGALIDRYQAYSSAPKQMIEIADQITLCAGMIEVFAKSVEGTGKQAFPRKFQESATSLITQVSDEECRSIAKICHKCDIPSASRCKIKRCS